MTNLVEGESVSEGLDGHVRVGEGEGTLHEDADACDGVPGRGLVGVRCYEGGAAYQTPMNSILTSWQYVCLNPAHNSIPFLSSLLYSLYAKGT